MFAPVRIESDEATRRHRAVCEKCQYYSMWHSLYATANALAKEHRKTKGHKRNNASPYRANL